MKRAAFLAAIREALSRREPPRPEDSPLASLLSWHGRARAYEGKIRYASVLVPLYERGDDVEAVFLRRSETLDLHPGQIAFPGGGRDPAESDLACALREAEEEVSLPPTQVRILGRLDPCPTNTGYLISPFVGEVLVPPTQLRPDPGEVHSIFTVPLSALLEPGSLREAPGPSGLTLDFFVHGDLVIWGATARMLRQLLELATGAPLVAKGEVPWEKVNF